MTQLKPNRRMLLLIVGRFLKKGRNLVIAFLLCLGSIEIVFGSRLGFSRMPPTGWLLFLNLSVA